MEKANKSTDSPQSSNIADEPMRCATCGTLLCYYSGRSKADLLMHCTKCRNNYDVTLHEGAFLFRRRVKHKSFSPKGH